MFGFNFWQRWLFVVSILIVLSGLGLTFLSSTPIFDALFNNPVYLAFWNTTVVDQPVRMFQQWVYAVLGMTLACFGVFLGFIAHTPFRKRERWAWTCIIAGMTFWFVIDTAFSAYFRVYVNVVVNVVLYLSVMLPVLFTRRYVVNS